MDEIKKKWENFIDKQAYKPTQKNFIIYYLEKGQNI